MAKKVFTIFTFIMMFAMNGVHAQEVNGKDPNELYAVIETNRGTMEFLLYRQVAPIAVSNFVNLATRGFYDGLTFHRVVDEFMIQAIFLNKPDHLNAESSLLRSPLSLSALVYYFSSNIYL